MTPTQRTLTFYVPGIAQPQGSVRAWMVPGRKFPNVTTDNPNLKAWRKLVALHALREWGARTTDKPLTVRLTFLFKRPASVKPKKRPEMTVKPDIDKLARGILDSLTGVIWEDDAQVVTLWCMKAYSDDDTNGVYINVDVVAAQRDGEASR